MINTEILNQACVYVKKEIQKLQFSSFDDKYCVFVEEGTEENNTIYLSIKLRNLNIKPKINLGFRFSSIDGKFMYIYFSENGKFNGAKYSNIEKVTNLVL